jgi:hypothetical protein
LMRFSGPMNEASAADNAEHKEMLTTAEAKITLHTTAFTCGSS